MKLTNALLSVGLTSVIVAGAAAQVSRDATPTSVNIWQEGSNSLWVVSCSDANVDLNGVTVEARKEGWATRANSCYMARNFVSVIWSRGPGTDGPDVIVLGRSGGSAACGDVIAITFDTTPKLRPLSFCPAEQVPILLAGEVPEFDASLDVEGFNEGYGADAAVGNIVIAAHRDGFVADLRTMVAGPLTADERQRIRSIMVTDLHRWAISLNGNGPADLSTPDTVRVLLNLVLSGRADQARTLLFAAGSAGAGPSFKAEAYWDDFCLAVITHPLWKRFDLDRLPHADLAESAAREGKEGRKGRDYVPAP